MTAPAKVEGNGVAQSRLASVLAALAARFPGEFMVDPQYSDQWRCPCPLHPHQDGWLYISLSALDGRVLLDCPQGCRAAAIATQAGLERKHVTDSDEVIAALPRAHSGAHTAAGKSDGKPARFRLLSDVELEQLPAIEFLVDGVLPLAGFGAIYGAPGAGKSFLALDMACCIATGATWLGRHTRQGPVVYIAAEGSAGLLQRLTAWKRQQGIDGLSVPVHFVTEPVNLLTGADVEALLLAFATLPKPPLLVIIDTMHRSMPGGDENSAKDVGLVLEHADRIRRVTKTSVLIVHHSGHESERERGSSSLRGYVDSLLYAKYNKNESLRELRCEKAKDWPAFEPIPFELLTVGESCVVMASNSVESNRGDALSVPMRQALTALSAIALSDGATVAEWKGSAGMPDSSFWRARKELVSNGYVAELKRGNAKRYSLTASGVYALTLNSQATLKPLSPVPTPLTLTLSESFRTESGESSKNVDER